METDLSILKKKALSAISKYGVDAVIANELDTRRWKVHVYRPDPEKAASLEPELKTIEIDPEERQRDIEEPLVVHVVSLFKAYLLNHQ